MPSRETIIRLVAEKTEKAVITVLDAAFMFVQSKNEKKLKAMQFFWGSVPKGSIFCASKPFSIRLKNSSLSDPDNLFLVQKDQGILFMGMDWPPAKSAYDPDHKPVCFNFYHNGTTYEYLLFPVWYVGTLPFYVLR
jgi:hypothetical protein